MENPSRSHPRIPAFEPLVAGDESSFEDLYRIYTESIDVRERKPRDQIAAMIERPDYRVLLARRGGWIAGFSVVFLPNREPFALLEYMAVQEADRSGGIGAELFRQTLRLAASVQGDVPLLLEVDSDRGGDRTINRRRILFYRRLGCRRVEGLAYILPLPLEGPPPEMDLLIQAPNATDQISKPTLERWLKVIYQDVYGCSPEDPRIARMIEPVADPVELV